MVNTVVCVSFGFCCLPLFGLCYFWFWCVGCFALFLYALLSCFVVSVVVF